MLKPIIFCDFDGVINALPYEKVWIGSEYDDINSLELYDRTNWRIDTLTPDPETHFVLDRQEEVSGMRMYPLLLNLSTELITELNTVINTGSADFMWLTAWRENTQTILNPLLPLPTDTPYLDWYQRSSDYHESGKLDAIHTYFDAHPNELTRPVVWIDDVATEFHQNHREDVYSTENGRYSWFAENNIPHLIIHTDARWGISREELTAIQTFVAQF